jgi:hypothetical protein
MGLRCVITARTIPPSQAEGDLEDHTKHYDRGEEQYHLVDIPEHTCLQMHNSKQQ